jgi:WD40 repeat protein
LWNVPAGGVSKDLIDAQASLRGCNGRVSALQFHPFASNVLASADFGLDVGAVRLWDAAQGQQRASIEGHNDVILDLQFSPNGSMLATSCKDGNIRLIDPRAGRVVSSWATPECYKDCSLVFASDHSLISVGCARQSARFVSLWDIRNTQSAPVGSKLELDPSNVCPIPFVDRDSNLLYLAHTGERTVQYVQILEGDDASLTLLGQYQSAELIGAIVPRSKQACDVRSVTMMTTLALTKRDVVTPIQFRLQRKRLEYFQDDLYPPTRSTVGENWLSADAWFGGSTGTFLICLFLLACV